MQRMLSLTLLSLLLSACSHSAVRYEFYREEVRFLHTEGNNHYQAGDYEKAAEQFQQIIEYVPDYAEAHASLGNVSLAMNQAEKAQKHYTKAVELKPELKGELDNSIAYSATLPKPENTYTYEKFVQILNKIELGGIDEFKVFSEGIKSPISWADNQRKLHRAVSADPSKPLLAAYDRGEFNDCGACLRLTAAWFSAALESRYYDLISRVMSRPEGKEIAPILAYRLGLAQERNGDRVAALKTYLLYPDDPNIKQRLVR